MSFRANVLASCAGLLAMGSPALPSNVFAQALAFEQVGDVPLDAEDLQFDQEGTLWADAGELYRLLVGTNTWEEVNTAAGIGGNILVLNPDTLFLADRSSVHRSVDGGESFTPVYSEGGGLFEAAVDGLNSGVILVGETHAGTGIAYSTDRGTNFTSASFTVSPSTESTLESAVEILEGPAAGRLVAGCFNGIFVSEDGGQTWAPSSLFQDFRYYTQRVIIGGASEAGGRQVASTLIDGQASSPQLYTSDDDGLTWTNVPDMVDAFLFVLVPGTPAVYLAVGRGYDLKTERIPLWRSLDGGKSWEPAGELPAEPNGGGIITKDFLIGPDGHAYVAVLRAGTEHEWVYRSTEPVVVANEPGVPETPETSVTLSVRPNPAFGQTQVVFEVAETTTVRMEVFDALGRTVAVLADGRYEPGRYTSTFGGSDLASGLYVVRVTVTPETSGLAQTYAERITLLK